MVISIAAGDTASGATAAGPCDERRDLESAETGGRSNLCRAGSVILTAWSRIDGISGGGATNPAVAGFTAGGGGSSGSRLRLVGAGDKGGGASERSGMGVTAGVGGGARPGTAEACAPALDDGDGPDETGGGDRGGDDAAVSPSGAAWRPFVGAGGTEATMKEARCGSSRVGSAGSSVGSVTGPAASGIGGGTTGPADRWDCGRGAVSVVGDNG